MAKSYVERLIGTIRREGLDQVPIIGARNSWRILASYAAYYNQTGTHLAFQKDAPFSRPVQRCGHVVAIPILSGLRHQICADVIFGWTISVGCHRQDLQPQFTDRPAIDRSKARIDGMRLGKARQEAADCDDDGRASEEVADAVMRARAEG
jgi:hypothetical protein